MKECKPVIIKETDKIVTKVSKLLSKPGSTIRPRIQIFDDEEIKTASNTN